MRFSEPFSRASRQLESPRMARIRQHFDNREISDVEAELKAEFDRSGITVSAGERIAVAVGSRGVANIARVVRALVHRLKAAGAEPFIVPAMGSHGGATAAGQLAVLEGYGVTEPFTGARILSSMETVRLEAPGLDLPLFMDRLSWESDGIILVNRVKPHTDYHGYPESGLMKMAVIGLGKHDQALAVHAFGVEGLRTKILPAGRLILAGGRIRGAIGLVENAYDRTVRVRALRAEDIEREERKLLETARAYMPTLPADRIDVLVVDEMGKDVSGVGMDPNIIGRIRIRGQEEPAAPAIKSILVRALTGATHGNALGVGLADVATTKLFEAVSFTATYENVATSSFLERGKLPMIAEDGLSAFSLALRGAALGPVETAAPRIVRIRNTLHIADVLVSEPMLEELSAMPGLEILETGLPLFSSDGTFTPWPD